MDRRVYVSEYRLEQGNLRTCGLRVKHDHPLRLQQTLERLRLAQHAHGLQDVRLTVCPVRSQQTLSPSSLRFAAAFTGHGGGMALYQCGLYRAVTCV